MSQDQQSPPSPERLQEIRDADAMAGENLQNCPSTWAHRRDLLVHIDRTAKRFLDGETLYAMFVSSHAQRNCGVDSWKELSDDDRDVWNQVAETVTQGFQQ